MITIADATAVILHEKKYCLLRTKHRKRMVYVTLPTVTGYKLLRVPISIPLTFHQL